MKKTNLERILQKIEKMVKSNDESYTQERVRLKRNVYMEIECVRWEEEDNCVLYVNLSVIKNGGVVDTISNLYPPHEFDMTSLGPPVIGKDDLAYLIDCVEYLLRCWC